MTRSFRSPVSILVLVLISATPLFAQNPDTTARDTTRKYKLPPVIVTGTLSTLSPEKAGVARSVVTSEQLRAEPSKAAVDPLRRVTGVYIDEVNGPLGPTIIRLRGGEESFTQVSMDGVPINENGGFFDAQGFSLVNVDRVEVARGPQSVLYGSSAVSGVVQMFSRIGDVGPMRTAAAIEAGAASEYGSSLRGSVEASGGSERARYAFGVGSAYDRGMFRLPNDARSNDASLRADYMTSGALAYTGVARFSGVDANLPVRNPGAMRADLDSNQKQGRDRVLGSLTATWRPDDRWTNQASVSYYRRDFDYEDTRDSAVQTVSTFFVPNFTLKYASTVERTIARFVGTVTDQTGSTRGSSFSYGGEWGRETLNDTTSGEFGSSATSLSRENVAAFAEGQAYFGRVSLLAGSRIEKFGDLDAAFVPRGTVVVGVVPRRMSLRAAVSRAYKAPNIQDQFNTFLVPNPDLKPESSVSWEVGTDLSAAKWNTTVSLTWFHQEYFNLIRSVSAGSSGQQTNRNLGESRAVGLEADIVAHPRAKWDVGVSGAWTTTTIVDSGYLPSSQFPKGEVLPFRPTYTASAFVGLPATKSISVLARVTSIGPQTVLSDRFRGTRETLASMQVLGATATWNIKQSMDAYFQLEHAVSQVSATGFDRNGPPPSRAALGMRVRR
jgi:vitamin B12 transporter